MTDNTKDSKDVIDLVELFKTLLSKKKKFFIVWIIVFALSCLWIFPQPRYYTCEVSLAPEATGEAMGGGLSSLAANFGFDLSSGGSDAIYPSLYPDLMESNRFVVGLLNIRVKKEDGSVDTDYYTYLAKHQQKNWLTQPFLKLKQNIKNMFAQKTAGRKGDPKKLDPFMLSEEDNAIIEKVKMDITLSVDKKTDVITIGVKDQDRLICATLADSIRQRLQDYITQYRTKKSRVDADHYKALTEKTRVEYNKAVSNYSSFCDAHQGVVLQSILSERKKLEEEMQLKLNTYSAMKAQYETMNAKVQERTPAFTILKEASVPIKPAGPKRMIFVIGMLIVATFATSIWLTKDILITK